MRTLDWMFIFVLVLLVVAGFVTINAVGKVDRLTTRNAALTTALEQHRLSAVSLELHETSVWGLEQALDDVIGDLNDCVEATK